MTSLSIATLPHEALLHAAFVHSAAIPTVARVTLPGTHAGDKRTLPMSAGWVRPREEHWGGRCCTRPSRRMLFNTDQADASAAVADAGQKAAKNAATTTWSGVPSNSQGVSQRKEHDAVLKNSAANDRSDLKARGARKADMSRASQLCVDSFRGPFEWWMLPVRMYQTTPRVAWVNDDGNDTNKQQMYFSDVEPRAPKRLDVADAIAEVTSFAQLNSTEMTFLGHINQRIGRITRNEIQHSMVVVEDTKSHDVVGFLEIGMLPRPTSSEQIALAASSSAAGAGEYSTENVSGQGDTTGEEFAGKGGGEDLRELGNSELSGSQNVAFLANVVVSRDQRRRGVGRLLVNAAIEIISKLWEGEERVYVTVEKGNDAAIALYTGMGFELTALEDEILARSRKRPARLYFSRALVDSR